MRLRPLFYWAAQMFRAAFYTGTRTGLPGFYNRLVRWFERGPYSHCELVFSDGAAASASFMDRGVRFKHIEFDPDRWDFVDLPAQYEFAARAWFVDHDGQAYDIVGNIRFLLGFLPDSKHKWFCSEAMAAALGIYEPFRYGPNGLWSVLKLYRLHD